jgi:hypothetical protein
MPAAKWKTRTDRVTKPRQPPNCPIGLVPFGTAGGADNHLVRTA